MKKFITTALLSVTLFASSFSAVAAFDGQVNLTNRVGDEGRCWAGAVLMQNQTYKILVSCRDITYPGGNEVFYYVMWANPANGGNAERLGDLGIGKNEFQTRNEFTSLFVTREKGTNVNSPSGSIVMQGTLQPIGILSENGKTTTTNTPTASEPPVADIVVTPIPTPQARTGIAKFLTSGILAILGIGGLIFVVFLVTKR